MNNNRSASLFLIKAIFFATFSAAFCFLCRPFLSKHFSYFSSYNLPHPPSSRLCEDKNFNSSETVRQAAGAMQRKDTLFEKARLKLVIDATEVRAGK